MVIPIKDLLQQVARENGHANWDLATYRLDQKSLHELYIKVIQKATSRGFNKGWSERARLVSYPRNKLEEIKQKEHQYINEKLLEQ